FRDLIDKFECIERARGTKKSKLDVIFTKELKDVVKGQSVFPLVRLLVPLYDTERQRYGLKQAAVAKTYVDALQLNRSSSDAQRLIHWKDQSRAQNVHSTGAVGGDFCSILENILMTRVRADSSTATLGDINSLLDRLTEAYGEAGKVSFIREHVLTKFNAREQKWLMRIIFQDLKIGIKLESVLGVLSPWASQCFAESSDLRMICEGGRGKKRPMGLKPHSPFAPMLAKGFPNTGQLLEVERAMAGGPFVMDVKLDGERMLCHVGSILGCKLFTRNGNDYTHKYNTLAADLKNVMTNCRSYILDGEVCALDSTTGKFVAFGNNRSVGLSENSDTIAALVYIVFDIVFAEGTGVVDDIDRILQDNPQHEGSVSYKSDLCGLGGELTHLPLFARRKLLEERLCVIPNRVIRIEHKLIRSMDVSERQRQIESYFNEMMEAGEEGLVVKSWVSAYELGEKSRFKNASWIKMKPEYSNNMTDLDLLILGGYYGEGKGVRAEGVSHFLLGVKDDSSSTDDMTKYLTVGKIGTGYSFAELEELRSRLNPHWRPWPSVGSRQPNHFAPWKIGKRDDIPHVWIPPEASCIVETRCAEITVSTNFAIGLTCRFPRVSKIRYDKEISGVMTSTQFIEAQNRRRTMREPVGDNSVVGATGSRKRSRTTGSQTEKPTSAAPSASYVIDIARNISSNKISEIFSGKLFCVLENSFNIPESVCATIQPRSLNSASFVSLICRHGGTVVANPVDDSCVIICGNKKTQSVKNIISSKKFDVIDFVYILECIEANNLLPISTRHFVGMGVETASRFLSGCDIFGDSFNVDILERDLYQLYTDMNFAF
ncbi:unnamed protein product, partial [Ectocarpus fasciculatus]